jgi:hypothetical protein
MLSDDLTTRLTRLRLDRSTRMLFIELLTYCSRNLTDGLIDVPLNMVTDHPAPAVAINELIERGLVEDQGDTYYLPEFLATNYTAERVERLKSAARKRKSDYNERQALHAAGDHSKCTKNCPANRAERNAVPGRVRNASISSPLLKKRGESADAPQRASGALAASAPPESQHVFVAKNHTDHCLACDLPRSNRVHQTNIPEALSNFAAPFAERGLLCRAALCDNEWEVSIDQDGVTLCADFAGSMTQPGPVVTAHYEFTSLTKDIGEDDLDRWQELVESHLTALAVRASVSACDSNAHFTWLTLDTEPGGDLGPIAASVLDLVHDMAHGRCQS